MSDQLNTEFQLRECVESVRHSLDTKDFLQSAGLRAACLFWTNRYARLSISALELYRYLHGNGPKPVEMPSVVANWQLDSGKPNIYYMCKELRKCFPHELRQEYLVHPIGAMFQCYDYLYEFYRDDVIYRGMHLCQAFLNFVTRKKSHDPNFENEREYRMERQRREVDEMEQRFKDHLLELSTYFAKLENTALDPKERRAKKMASGVGKICKKLGVKNEYTGRIAQDRALKIWEHGRTMVAAANMAKGKRKVSIDDVFAVYKDDIVELGYNTPRKFKNAVNNALRRKKNVEL